MLRTELKEGGGTTAFNEVVGEVPLESTAVDVPV